VRSALTRCSLPCFMEPTQAGSCQQCHPPASCQWSRNCQPECPATQQTGGKHTRSRLEAQQVQLKTMNQAWRMSQGSESNGVCRHASLKCTLCKANRGVICRGIPPEIWSGHVPNISKCACTINQARLVVLGRWPESKRLKPY